MDTPNSSPATTTSSFILQVMKVAGLAAGVGVVWYMTSDRFRVRWCSGKQQLTRDSMLSFLTECAKQYHAIFTELAAMAQNVKRSLRSKGIENALPQEEFEAMLLQEGFQHRLKSVQTTLLDNYNCSEQLLQKSADAFKMDEEVLLYVNGIKAMYEDAVDGVLPLMPSMVIPPQLDEKTVLKIISQLHEEKQKLFADVFGAIDSREHCVELPGAGPVPSRELQEKLQAATEQAETAVMERNKTECVNQQTYQHAVAAYSRNEEFKKLKVALEEIHSDVVVKIMRPKDRQDQTARHLVFGENIIKKNVLSVEEVLCDEENEITNKNENNNKQKEDIKTTTTTTQNNENKKEREKGEMKSEDKNTNCLGEDENLIIIQSNENNKIVEEKENFVISAEDLPIT
eukprot:GHVS01076491.1.p1 GENE.GHVS01076491.1~~GHVS01076491.1.p1  ORF type:complete len:400 (-),score=87.05 GHVS01076491.1:370-1569(-)